MASAITNMEIEALAKGIGINQKLDGLGLKLGYEYETIDVYKARNHSDAKVTYQGTKQMLRDWRDEITQEELQRPILKKALEDAGLARLAEKYLGGEAAMGTGQAGRSEKLSEQPQTQTQTGGTNIINASGASNVSGNNVIGQQTNNYNSAPPAPDVHHHYPARPVYIPVPQAPKRPANNFSGPAPKRAKVTASVPSTSKGTTSKPKGTTSKPKGTTSKPKGTTSKPKGSASKPKGTTSKPKGTTSKPKRTTTKSKGTTSKPKGTTSKPKGTTSKPKRTTSKPKRTTSKPKGTTSKPKRTTSKPKGTTSKPKKTASRQARPQKKSKR
eukprot:XP_011662977.1 PREDICTED: salivary glue protein Sgs-3-like [Strongylocentrotus purpuratus]